MDMEEVTATEGTNAINYVNCFRGRRNTAAPFYVNHVTPLFRYPSKKVVVNNYVKGTRRPRRRPDRTKCHAAFFS